MAKVPNGVEKFKGAWGISYSYKGIQILKSSGRWASGYDFKVGSERILARTLVESVKEIERVLQEVK